MTENDDLTGTYNSFADLESAEGSLKVYNNEESSDRTFSYSELENQSRRHSQTHGIEIGTSIILRDKTYTITGIISEGTGEAIIYQIVDQNKSAFVLKLYFEFNNPDEEPNHETLSRIKNITDPDILKLYDFGAGFNAEKYKGRFCYEISELAEGGDLFAVADFKAKYTSDFIETNIVPETFSGLRRLHELGIYHCDLKPGNIFYKDAAQTDIVIGDYGSAKTYDNLRHGNMTVVLKGTRYYFSPEQAAGIVSEKNDYYSFGMILAHLLYPEQFCEDGFRNIAPGKFKLIKQRQFAAQDSFLYDSLHLRLNRLIAGLTLYSPDTRWGESEVKGWLAGENIEVKYRHEVVKVAPIKISGRRELKTEAEVIHFLETGKNWKAEIIANEDSYLSFRRWLEETRDKDEKEKVKDFIDFYKLIDAHISANQSAGVDYTREALLRYFQPEKPVRIEMNVFDFASDIEKEVTTFIANIDEIWKLSNINSKEHLENIRFNLFQLEFALRQKKLTADAEQAAIINLQIDKLLSVFGLTQKPFIDFKTDIQSQLHPDKAESNLLLLNLFYAFNPTRAFRDLHNQQLDTLEDVALFFACNEEAFANYFLTLERERFLESIGRQELVKLDYNDFIFEVFKHNAENHVELLFVAFDSRHHYRVSYKYYKSLNRFLTEKDISRNFTSHSPNYELYETRRRFFQSFADVCDNFITAIKQKHNGSSLPDKNLVEIKKKFVSDSREIYSYLLSERFAAIFRALFSKPMPKKNLDELFEAEISLQNKFHWKPAFASALASVPITVILLGLLAYWAGWIFTDQNTRYLTFDKSVNLDGTNYNAGDYLKVNSDNNYAVCLDQNASNKCYPTKTAAIMFSSEKSIPPADKIGVVDYEFKQPRKVFKVTKKARIGGQSFSVGSIIDISLDDGQQWCFKVRGKDPCSPRQSSKACGGRCSDPIDNYGYIISNYRGRELFTFNQNAMFGGYSYQGGESLEVASSSEWAICLKAVRSEQCHLNDNAINRFSQPNVPVVTDSGSIGTRDNSLTKTGIWTFAFIVLLVAIPYFWYGSQVAKKLKLLYARGRAATIIFNQLGVKEEK